jgi:hypothetical protein
LARLKHIQFAEAYHQRAEKKEKKLARASSRTARRPSGSKQVATAIFLWKKRDGVEVVVAAAAAAQLISRAWSSENTSAWRKTCLRREQRYIKRRKMPQRRVRNCFFHFPCTISSIA